MKPSNAETNPCITPFGGLRGKKKKKPSGSGRSERDSTGRIRHETPAKCCINPRITPCGGFGKNIRKPSRGGRSERLSKMLKSILAAPPFGGLKQSDIAPAVGRKLPQMRL